MSGLKANDFVEWKSSATLAATAGTPFTGGTDGTVGDTAYQTYLDQAESYSFNAMGCTSTTDSVKTLFVNFVKRMRDEVGKKFQVVCFSKLADHEGVVSVKNGLSSNKTSADLIPWVTGVIAGTAVNKSATNLTYDGEYDVDIDYTQSALEAGIKEGSFMLHRVDDDVCVLTDINSFISFTDEKSEDFASNQTVNSFRSDRERHRGFFGKKGMSERCRTTPRAGSRSWNDIVTHHRQLESVRAIEDFRPAERDGRSGREQEVGRCDEPRHPGERHGAALHDRLR